MGRIKIYFRRSATVICRPLKMPTAAGGYDLDHHIRRTFASAIGQLAFVADHANVRFNIGLRQKICTYVSAAVIRSGIEIKTADDRLRKAAVFS